MTLDPRVERQRNIKAFAIVGLIFAVLGVIVWYVATHPERLFDTDGAEYGSSLANSVPIGEGGGGCGRAAREDWWFCGVEKDAGSGYGAYYVLRTDSEGCWTARRASLDRIRREAPTKDLVVIEERGRAISDCVGIMDFAFPSNPYGFNAARAGPPEPFALRSG